MGEHQAHTFGSVLNGPHMVVFNTVNQGLLHVSRPVGLCMGALDQGFEIG